jgi:hypothetical protein
MSPSATEDVQDPTPDYRDLYEEVLARAKEVSEAAADRLRQVLSDYRPQPEVLP